jgi:hypothetical protein
MESWKLLPMLVLPALVSSCVEPIDFDTGPPPELLVVDGRITTNTGPHPLYLSKLVPYGKQYRIPVTGASVTLFENTGRRFEYQPSTTEPGRYELNGVQGQVGRSYYIEIRLPGERTYRSEPETMQPVPMADSLSFSLAYEELQPGTALKKWFFSAAVHVTLEPQEVGPYLRWEVETVHSFLEERVHPLQVLKTCYITEPLEPQQIRLFDGSGVRGRQPINVRVGRKRVSWVFNWRHYFNVYQSSLSERAYRYWSDVNKVSNQVGDIFDSPPAAIRGNLYNVADAEEQVLGFFGASAIDTVRRFSVRADFPEEVRSYMIPLCRWRSSGPPPRACFNCLLFPNSSYDRPDYF